MRGASRSDDDVTRRLQRAHGPLLACPCGNGPHGAKESCMRRSRIVAAACAVAPALASLAAVAKHPVLEWPGTHVHCDHAGNVVGVRMFGCGDPGWGIVTSKSKAYNGCIM